MKYTFADGHGSDGTLDSILSLLAIFTIEVDTELIVFSLSRSPSAHGCADARIEARMNVW